MEQMKFTRLIPEGDLPAGVWDRIAMVVHMMSTKGAMTPLEIQAALFAYYKDYNTEWDGLVDVSGLSLIYIEVCLLLACEVGCAKRVD